MKHIIMLLDMDAFFASCHQAGNPSTFNKPVVVSRNTYNSIIVAASYEAKKLGISTTTHIQNALMLYPNLIVFRPDFNLYNFYSLNIFKYIHEHFKVPVEIASIDECYIDATHMVTKYNSAVHFGYTIRNQIKAQFNLKCTIGISTNKFLAKMACNLKKPYGVMALPLSKVPTILWPLPVKDMHGVGRAKAKEFEKLKIHTIEDLANYGTKMLTQSDEPIDKNMLTLIKRAQGIDSDVVDAKYHHVKSIGKEYTFEAPTQCFPELKAKLFELTMNCVNTLVFKQLKCKNIGLILKYSQKKIIRHQLKHYTDNFNFLFNTLLTLLEKKWNGDSLILVGVSLSSFAKKYEQTAQQLYLTNLKQNQKPVKNPLQPLLNSINYQYGHPVIMRGDQYNPQLKHRKK